MAALKQNQTVAKHKHLYMCYKNTYIKNIQKSNFVKWTFWMNALKLALLASELHCTRENPIK